jgi:hypothetical protein
MGQGLAALLSPPRLVRQRAGSCMSFVELLSCIEDALQFRLAGIPDRTLDGLFNTPVLRRPTAEDLSVSAWTQTIGARTNVSVLAIQTPNDAVLYVDGRPAPANADDVASAVARGVLPDTLASIPARES